MKSIRTQIMSLTVCAISIAMTISAVLGMSEVKRARDESTGQLLNLLCEAGKKNLDYYFIGVEQSVDSVHSFAENDLKSIEREEFVDHIERVRDYFDKIASVTNGVRTYYYRIDPEFSNSVKGFWYTSEDGSKFKEHEVTDISQYDTDDTTSLVWFTVPKKTGSPIWLPPYVTENLNARVISYNVPVYLGDEFVGVIGIEIDYSTMAKQVDSICLYENGYAFINAEDGRLIYHPLFDVTQISEEEKPAVPDGILENNEFVHYRYNGVDKIGVWKVLSNGMRLNVSVPVSEVNSGWYRLILKNILVLTVLLAIGILMTFRLSSRIVSPLRRLIEAVGMLNEDNLNFKLEYNADDEVGILTRAFRKLSEHIKIYITAMEADYRSVYYVNIDEDYVVCYRVYEEAYETVHVGDTAPFAASVSNYAKKYVSEQDREEFLAFLTPETIRDSLADEKMVFFRYLTKRGGMDHYEMVRVSALRETEDGADDRLRVVVMGFSDVDKETRDEMAKNTALLDALNQAEEASAAKTAFLSSMSHEIRTPMNAIIGYNTLAMNESNLSEKIRDYLEKSGSAARHLLKLINDILDMSRIESGRMTIRNEEFCLGDMLDQINIMISGQCRTKNLEYDCHINGDLSGFYIGDETKLKQVIINILGNAVKYTPSEGTVSFQVEETSRFDGNANLRFTIKDTGIGIKPEFLPRIYDAFAQEDDGKPNAMGSTGLGLAISKSIVDMMNGKIEVQSEKGKGSVFNVSVTLKVSDRVDSEDEDSFSAADLRVLIIDDDPDACEHVRHVLNGLGITSDFCNRGEDAYDIIRMAKARLQPYNLILMDWKMPEVAGVDVTRIIREEIDEDAAIIILTAYNWDDIYQEAADAGVDGFIAKPLEAPGLLDKFRRVIRSRERTREKTEKTDLKGKHILIAEDMIINAEILETFLEMEEMETEVAENGQICVDKFSESPEGTYDAILMDIRMPVLDGLGAAEAIRALDREDAKRIPIIAMTANAFDEDVQRSLQAGMNAHLTKPVDAPRLIEILQTLIR